MFVVQLVILYWYILGEPQEDPEHRDPVPTVIPAWTSHFSPRQDIQTHSVKLDIPVLSRSVKIAMIPRYTHSRNVRGEAYTHGTKNMTLYCFNLQLL